MFEDIEPIADAVVDVMKSALTPVHQRLLEIEKRVESVRDGRDGDPGRDGVDGKDAPPVDISEVVKQAAALIPIPKDGRDGQDGKDAPVVDLLEVAKAAAALIPAPADGKAGPQGEPGRDGQDGKDAPPVDLIEVAKQAAALIPPPADGKDGKDADVDALVALVVEKSQAAIADAVARAVAERLPDLVAESVTKAVAAIPVPKDGKDGIDGQKGADGVGLAGALLDEAGRLVVTLSNGSVHTLGVVKGAKGEDGKDGKDGRDGVSFDDLTVEHDGEQTVSFVVTKGDYRKEHQVKFPVMVHRGVWSATKTYDRGECATWAGSMWMATRQTSGFKPGDGPTEKTGWVMVTKRGSDGRNGKDGEPGKPGRDGKDGPKW